MIVLAVFIFFFIVTCAFVFRYNIGDRYVIESVDRAPIIYINRKTGNKLVNRFPPERRIGGHREDLTDVITYVEHTRKNPNMYK